MHARRTKLYIAIALAIASSQAGAEGQDADDLIAACARIAAVGDRILCLENALRGVADDVPEPAAQSDAPATDDRATAVAIDESAEDIAEDMAVGSIVDPAPVVTETPGSGEELIPSGAGLAAETPAGSTSIPASEISTPAEIPSTTAVSAESQPDEDAARPVDELGAEQVRARSMSQEERLAELDSAENLRVASYSKVPYEKLVVELENGQVWRQIRGDVQKIRVNLKRNQTVTISESRFGGYQLRLNEIERTIRVQRIR